MMNFSVKRFQHGLGLALVAWSLAACGGIGDADPTTVPTPEQVIGSVRQTAIPLPNAPEWRSPAEPLNRENVARAELLGRLDAPGEMSTLFDYDFSPDGTSLVALNNTQILAWDLITGRQLISTSRGGYSFVFYSPDKSNVYLIDPDGEALVLDATTGDAVAEFTIHNNFNGSFAYEPFNGWLAVGGDDGRVDIWDMVNQEMMTSFDTSELSMLRMAFSPDGSILVTVAADRLVQVWKWQENEQLTAFENQGLLPRRFAFSPDGTRLATALPDYIAVYSLETQETLYSLNTGEAGDVIDVLAYSPDGRYLISGGSLPDMIVWDGETGEFLALLPEVGGDVTAAAFSPDGSLLLASVLNGPVTLWDMSGVTDETMVRANLDIGSNRILDVAFTSDGFSMLFFDALGPVYVWGIAPSE